MGWGMKKALLTMGVVVGVASSSLALAATSYPRNNQSGHQDYYIGLNIAPTFYVSHSSGASTIEPATSSYRVHGGSIKELIHLKVPSGLITVDRGVVLVTEPRSYSVTHTITSHYLGIYWWPWAAAWVGCME